MIARTARLMNIMNKCTAQKPLPRIHAAIANPIASKFNPNAMQKIVGMCRSQSSVTSVIINWTPKTMKGKA
jgi:hypothetical protein